MSRPLRNQAFACTGKLRFLTWTQASHAADRSRKSKGRTGERFNPYHCHHCGGFHVGSDKMGVRKKERREWEE